MKILTIFPIIFLFLFNSINAQTAYIVGEYETEYHIILSATGDMKLEKALITYGFSNYSVTLSDYTTEHKAEEMIIVEDVLVFDTDSTINMVAYYGDAIEAFVYTTKQDKLIYLKTVSRKGTVFSYADKKKAMNFYRSMLNYKLVTHKGLRR